FAAVFAFEALLLAGLGIFAGRIACSPPYGSGFWFVTALLAICVVGYPLLAPLAGRPWTTAETFGVTPDPTAIGAVAALVLVRRRIRWLLLIVPLLWCAVAAATRSEEHTSEL